jgi:hypothetical protein
MFLIVKLMHLNYYLVFQFFPHSFCCFAGYIFCLRSHIAGLVTLGHTLWFEKTMHAIKTGIKLQQKYL